jgi:hypothetical protein
MHMIDWMNLLENDNDTFIFNNLVESLIRFYSVSSEFLNELKVYLRRTNIL